MHKCFLFFTVVSGLLLGACAGQTLKLEPEMSNPAVTVMQERIAGYTQWDTQMRIALRHDKLSWRGLMQWIQRKDDFRMIFTNLLGRRLMLIESLADGKVQAIDSKGYREQASDPSALLKSMLGTEVPIDSLHYWLLGVPAPGEPYFSPEFDAERRLLSYEQNGWTIGYTDYRGEECLDWLPSRLTLNRNQTQLWLHIRSWQTPPGAIKTSTC